MSTATIVRRHLVLGWGAACTFAAVGVALEILHGFKIGWYLDVASETRRHLLTLGHAHGTLVGLANVLFAATVAGSAYERPGAVRVASAGLASAALLLPTGFLLGALNAVDGDPGAGILLVPPGAAALLVGLAAATLAATAHTDRSR